MYLAVCVLLSWELYKLKEERNKGTAPFFPKLSKTWDFVYFSFPIKRDEKKINAIVTS